MFTIRLAVPADAPALVRMNADFNEVDDVSPAAVAQSLQTSPEIVIVAADADHLIGFCCAQIHHSFCYTTPVAELTEMYVDPACRRQGCASAMLHFLEKHLRDTGRAAELHLLTGTNNLAARSAYTRFGFSLKNEVYMTKEIPRKH